MALFGSISCGSQDPCSVKWFFFLSFCRWVRTLPGAELLEVFNGDCSCQGLALELRGNEPLSHSHSPGRGFSTAPNAHPPPEVYLYFTFTLPATVCTRVQWAHVVRVNYKHLKKKKATTKGEGVFFSDSCLSLCCYVYYNLKGLFIKHGHNFRMVQR